MLSDVAQFIGAGYHNAVALIGNTGFAAANSLPIMISAATNQPLEKVEGDMFAAGMALGPVGKSRGQPT